MPHSESNKFGLNLRNRIKMFYNSIAGKKPKTNTLIDRFLLHLQRSPHTVCFSLGTDGEAGTYIYIKGVTERFGFDATRKRYRTKPLPVMAPVFYVYIGLLLITAKTLCRGSQHEYRKNVFL